MRFARDDAKSLGLGVGLYIRILVRNDSLQPNAALACLLENSEVSKYSVSKFPIVFGSMSATASDRAKAVGVDDTSSYVAALILARQAQSGRTLAILAG